jgi:hypothetical protein
MPGQDGPPLAIEEIAQSTTVVSTAPGKIVLPLKPDKTGIIAVQSKD